MAVRGGNKMGKGNQLHGKGDGTGARTIEVGAEMGDNDVLSNRDKKEHSKARGQDSRAIQTDQLQDHVANRGGG